MSKKNQSVSFGIGILIGVLGGILAGVAYAPKSGKESREQLKESFNNLVKNQSPSIKEAQKQAYESVDLIKYKVEKQFRKLIHMIRNRKMQKAKELEATDYDFN